jgi:WD40 repeat protein/predicted transcriptional regulator
VGNALIVTVKATGTNGLILYSLCISLVILCIPLPFSSAEMDGIGTKVIYKVADAGKAVRWSPDGSMLAASSGGKIIIYNTFNGTIKGNLSENDGFWEEIRDFDWSPDGSRIAACDMWHMTPVIWNVENARNPQTDNPPIRYPAVRVDWGSNGNIAYIGHMCLGEQLYICNENLDRLNISKPLYFFTHLAKWSPDGNYIAIEIPGYGLRLYNLTDSSYISCDAFLGVTGTVTDFSWSPEGASIAASVYNSSDSANIYIFDAQNGALRAPLYFNESRTISIAWSPDGSRIAAGQENGDVYIVDVQNLTAASLKGHKEVVGSVDWSPNGTLLASASLDDTVRIWGPFAIRSRSPEPLILAKDPPVSAGTSEFVTVSVLASSCLVISLVAVAIDETLRYSGTALILPLFTRLKKRAVLDNFTRGRLQGYIFANPGVHLSGLRDQFNISNGEATYHLRVLEREGYIYSLHDGFKRRFYPGERQKEISNLQELSVIQNLLLSIMMEHPGISETKLAGLAGTSQQVVSYHIRKLLRNGYVSLDRDGRVVKCRAINDQAKSSQDKGLDIKITDKERMTDS